MNTSQAPDAATASASRPPAWVTWLLNASPVTMLGVAVPVALVAGALVPDLGPIMLVALLGVVGGVVSFLRPGIGLFLFTLMLYSRASEVLTVSTGVPSIAPLFTIWLLTAVIMHFGFDGLFHARPTGWQALAVYGLVLLGSVLVAVDTSLAMLRVITYAREFVFIALIVMCLRQVSDLRIVVRALIVAGLIPACISVYQTLSGSTYTFLGFGQYSSGVVVPGEFTEVPRPSGMVGDPNFYALALIPLIPLALHRARWERSTFARQLFLLAAVVIAVASVLTYSRGGYVTLAAIVAGLVIAGFIRFRSLIVIGLLFVLLLTVLPSNHTRRFESLLNIPASLISQEPPERGTVADTSVSGRLSEIMAGVYMFTDHPILGVGANNYQEHYQEYARPLGINRRTDRAAHSLYVEIAAETGIVGIIAFTALVGTVFAALRRVWMTENPASEMHDLARSVAISILGILVASTFLHSAYPRFLIMTIGLAIGIASVANWKAAPRARLRFARLRPPPQLLTPSQHRNTVVWGGAVTIVAAMFASALIVSLSLDPSGASLFGGDTSAAIRPAQGQTAPAAPTSPDVGSGVVVTPTRTPTAGPSGGVTPATSTAVPTPAPTTITDLQRQAELLAPAVEPAGPLADCAYFAETRHNVCAGFETFFSANGGEQVFGAPISEQYFSGGLLIQYFERALFEWHSTATEEFVLLARLGAQQRLAATDQEIDSPAFPDDDDSGCIYEDTTGHNVCSRFAFHWLTFGGVPIYGYPISEHYDDDGVRIQYFERARFELRPLGGGEFELVVAPLGAEEVERILTGADDDGTGRDD